jgi:20S proteasome subunit beta 4
MDRNWRPDMSLDQILDVLRKCLAELKTRFIIRYETWKIKVVDKDGCREITL